MSWRIEICHRSTYRYDAEVRASHNEVRMTPIDTDRQRVLSTRFEVRPATSVLHYRDYWGTSVAAFDLSVPHRELAIEACALIETSAVHGRRTGCSWEELAETTLRDRFGEFLTQTTITTPDDRIMDAARELSAQSLTPPEAADAAVVWVRDHLSYQPGVTGVHTSATEALAAGVGVCQDFAHVTLSLLRELGIPARYVSGYLHPTPDAELGVTVAGESHAWVESYTGEWRAHDPTNGSPVGERHVVVGRGRDYRDVAPLVGVYQGGGTEHVEVAVELRRLA